MGTDLEIVKTDFSDCTIMQMIGLKKTMGQNHIRRVPALIRTPGSESLPMSHIGLLCRIKSP